MNETIFKYISEQNIGVLAVQMLDDSPHAATVHFAQIQDTSNANLPSILIMTDRSYKKCQPIIANGKTRASFVIGTDESEMKTVQMDGDVQFAQESAAKTPYFTKFPEKEKFYKADSSVFLIFTPSWWRYTNFKATDGNKIISSDD